MANRHNDIEGLYVGVGAEGSDETLALDKVLQKTNDFGERENHSF